MRSFRKAEGRAEQRLAERITRGMSELLRAEDFARVEVYFYRGRCVVLAMSAWSPVRDPKKAACGWEAFVSAAYVCGFQDISTSCESLPTAARWFTHRAATPTESILGFTADSW